MSSDQIQFLQGEKKKLKEILEVKPDTEWAKKNLADVESQIKKLKK